MCSCFAARTTGEKTENVKINNGLAGNQDDSLEEKFGFLSFDSMFPKYICFNHFSEDFAVRMIESYDIIVLLQSIY